ncbi:MAG: hypothetical protein CL685_04145 [Candidatus Magasanikbacteria bacterium]|nr:hypothetical protein [Candidatus Magasanikbacteria bacterium]
MNIYIKFRYLVEPILASLLLILISPLFIGISILITLNMGSPVIFAQCRTGLNNHPFNFYKFRTMTNKTDQKGQLLPDMARTTKLGHFLRQTSLDELPQLINIIKGDMSLIGPRPLIAEYIDYYTPSQKKRHTLKPGITGWAQVNGRNTLSWDEKFALDIDYTNQVSFLFDCKVILKTFTTLFATQSINHSAKQTMPDLRTYQAQVK